MSKIDNQEGLVELHSLLVHLLHVLLHRQDEALLDIIRDSNLVKIDLYKALSIS